MPAPMKWRTKILLAKIETVYGTDAAPTAALNAILATNVVYTPMEGSDVSRDLEQPYLGAQGTIPAELQAKLAFDVEMAPSGTAGTVPAWGPLLRACAMAQTISAAVSVTYNPMTDNHESLTVYFWIDTTRYVMLGARGSAKLMISAQGIPYLKYEFTSLYVQPAETARVTPVLTAFQKPQLASKANTPTFTLNAVAFVLRELTLDLGNQIEPRFLIGSEGILITDKAETLEATVEAQPLSAFNPFALAAAQTAVPLVLTHGVGAGKIATLNVPAAQMQRPQGLSNAQNIKEWPLRMVPLPTAGNDQFIWTGTAWVATLDLGAIPRGNIYQRGIVFEARALGVFGNNTNTIVELERRFKQLGGAFSAWTVISTWTLDFNDLAWTVRTGQDSLAGYYDDYEYRVKYNNYNGVGTGPTTGDCLRNVYPQFLEVLRFQLTTRVEFNRLIETNPDTLTDLERSARFLYLQRTAFGGKVSGRNFGVSKDRPARFNLTTLEPMLEHLHSRLAGVVIECLPWADFMRRYDGPGTLFYLDPPYWGCETDYGKAVFERADFERLAAALKTLQGRFIMSINDVPAIRETFAGFAMQEVETTYTIGSKGALGGRKELLIMGRAGV